MIEVEGSLQTLAEVSVALAGFASLLVVLRRDSDASVSQGQGADLFVVVGGNLLVLGFSLLPGPLHHIGVSDTTTWRFGSALLAIALLLGYLAILRLRASLIASGIQPTFPRVSRVSVHAPVPLIALLVAVSTGVFGSSAAGVYLLSLLLLVSMSSLPLFFLVVELAVESVR